MPVPTRIRWHARRAVAVVAVIGAVGVAGTGAQAQSPTTRAATPTASNSLSEPDLLSDPAFQRTGLAPWTVAPGQNWATYASTGAAVGGSYLETNAGSAPAPTLYQDVEVAPPVGQSYQASVFLRSPSSTPIGVALVVWATGGRSEEVGQSQFTVSSATWASFTTQIDIADAGHSALRFQLYLGTSGPSLDVDGAMLQDTGVSDAGFTQGLGSWIASPGQNWATYPSVASPVGVDYLETNAGSSSDPYLYQDVDTIPVVGHSYQASVFLRSPSSTPISVALVIWATGGSTEEVGQSQFTVSSSAWSEFYADLDVADPGHTGLRYQIYISTSGPSLDVGGPTLQDSGVSDAGFDQSGTGPWVVAPGASWDDETGTGAPAGQSWVETDPGSGSTSWFYQDVATNAVAGHPYTGSVFLKSVTGGPISIAVVLWALGGPAPAEVGQTLATVGPAWQQVTTELDVADAGHDDLRLQVYVSTADQTLGVDLAALPGVGADPPLGPPALVRGVGVYGPSSRATISSEIDQGWPVVGETGGLGTEASPYTAALSSAPDLAAAEAVGASADAVTWLSFWTVSAPSAGDSWSDDGYVAGQYVARYLDSVSSSVKPAFVILDPEGYANGQPNEYPSDASDWAGWLQGWSQGIESVDSSLTPALYVDQYEYAAFSIAGLDLPVFVAISPILDNYPGAGVAYSPGSNVDGYIAIGGGCPAAAYESTVLSWGGSYNTMQFPDSGDDCGP